MTKVMNIQVIDDARNCTYSIYEVIESDFRQLFEGDTDIEFIEEVAERLGEEQLTEISHRLWQRPVNKKSVCGIHGTLFYGLAEQKRRYYPTKKESEMVTMFGKPMHGPR